jgi:ubiquinone/menaquinone biosynthesis C-methylase UbiE
MEEVWRRRAWFYDSFLMPIFLPLGGQNGFRMRCVDFVSPAEEDQVLGVCCGAHTLISSIAGRTGRDGYVIAWKSSFAVAWFG